MRITFSLTGGVMLAVALIAAPATTGPLLAQRQVVVEYDPDSTPPRRVTLPAAHDVPLVAPGIPGTTLPVVDVMVNGRGPFRFAIETGAGFVGVSPQFAQTAGLTRSGGPDGFPEFHVDSLVIGGARFEDFTVSALPRAATGVDGVLGLPFFHDVLVTIDYPGKRLRLSRDTLPAANARDVLPLVRAGPFWALSVTIAGRPFTSVLDTRSTGLLSVTPEVAGQLPFAGELQVIGRARGVGVPDVDVKAGRLGGDVTFGAYTVRRPVLSIRPLPANFDAPARGPLFGDAVLQHFTVSLDQRTRRLRLRREGSPIIPVREPPGFPPPTGEGSEAGAARTQQ
ncbi:MAG: clan AA aspartic protease [Gemmatimonadetes bacterium]|nr:clan AA aspartic protease [Gemmatimonadota bacterium]